MAITTSLITVSTTCLSGVAPLSVKLELVRKLCSLYTDHQKCDDRPFLELMKSSMKCQLKSIHTSLDKVVVEFDLIYSAIFQPDLKTYIVNTFPILDEKNNVHELVLKKGVYFESTNFVGFADSLENFIDRTSLNYELSQCVSAIHQSKQEKIQQFCQYKLVDTNVSCLATYTETGLLVQTNEKLLVKKNCVNHYFESLSISGTVFYENEQNCLYEFVCNNILFKTDIKATNGIFYLNNILTPPRKMFQSVLTQSSKQLNDILGQNIPHIPLTTFETHTIVHYATALFLFILMICLSFCLYYYFRRLRSQQKILEQSQSLYSANT